MKCNYKPPKLTKEEQQDMASIKSTLPFIDRLQIKEELKPYQHWTPCSECIDFEDCEIKEDRDGCLSGTKEEDMEEDDMMWNRREDVRYDLGN